MAATRIDALVTALRAHPPVADVTGRPWTPVPLHAEALAALTLPDGEKPPAELMAWLHYDASWFARDPQGRIELAPLGTILARWATPMTEQDDEPPPSGAAISSDELLQIWLESLPKGATATSAAIEITYVPGSQEHILILTPRSVKVLGCEKRFEFWWADDSLEALVKRWLRSAR